MGQPKLKNKGRGQWKVDEEHGMDKIKEFCRGWYSQGLAAKGDNCNYIVANARQSMGSDISASSTYADEKEVLFRPGTVFAVVESFKCGAPGADGKDGTKIVDTGIRPVGKPCPPGAFGVT